MQSNMKLKYSSIIKLASIMGFVAHSIIPIQNTLETWTGFEFYNNFASMYPRRLSIGFQMFNLILAVFTFANAKKVDCWFANLLLFSAGDDPSRRKIMHLLLTMFIFAFTCKIHFGFFHHGISGWVYPDREFISDQPQLGGADDGLHDLEKVLRKEKVRYVPKKGYYSRPAMLLHYKDGSRRPSNYAVTGLVFDHILFGSEYVEIRQPKLFWKIFLDGYRRLHEGARFMLPPELAYLNHNPYITIDYRDYPDASEITGLSLWQFEIFADPEANTIRPVSSVKLAEVPRE